MTTRFGQRLRELRTNKGLGLREAAREAGIDSALWSKYETGKRRPPNPASKPKEAEKVIQAIAIILRTQQYDPFPELLALTTLPDDVPTDTIISLSSHYTRRYKNRMD